MRKRFLAKCLVGVSAAVIISGTAWHTYLSQTNATTTKSQSKIGNLKKQGTPPAKPSGSSTNNMPNDQTPPDGKIPPDGKPGNGKPAAPGGNAQQTSITLKGANAADNAKKTFNGTNKKTLTSSTGDESTILATNKGQYQISNATIMKSGDTSSNDNSNFFGLNAIIAATKNSSVSIKDSSLSSSGKGANALFATGKNATITANNISIKTTRNSSRGLDATYGGKITASQIDVFTSGDHCAALATDRGGGTITVNTGTLKTHGQGSPLIYSTGVINVNHISGEATGSQIVGMEGLNTVSIKNSNLIGSDKKASEPVANGIFLYQSMSGDSSKGNAKFTCEDSTLTSKIKNGAMFYITNTRAKVTLKNTRLNFDTAKNNLITAAGNDGSNGWGAKDTNGGNLSFTGIRQKLSGTISCDSISKINLKLTKKTTFTGTITNDASSKKESSNVSVTMDSTSTWKVTKNCLLNSLSITAGGRIVDKNGKTVTIKTTDGKTKKHGNSKITVTVKNYRSPKR